MRIYLPSTLPALARARDAGVVDGTTAYTVTPAVREWYVDDDLEDLEFTALLDAAQASLALLEADSEAPRLRLVAAADVPDAAVNVVHGGHQFDGGDTPRSQVTLTAPVDLKTVVSLHIDELSSQPVITTAVRALPAAKAGDEDAEFEISQAEGCDLLWYDITELDDLIG